MIKDLAELKKLIVLCRAQGVESIRFEGVELHLGALPDKAPKKVKQTITVPEFTPEQDLIYNTPELKEAAKRAIAQLEATRLNSQIDTPDELTEEQLLNWSVSN